MYNIHRDIPNNKWNVFEVVRGYEIFIRAFNSYDEANAYCNRAQS